LRALPEETRKICVSVRGRAQIFRVAPASMGSPPDFDWFMRAAQCPNRGFGCRALFVKVVRMLAAVLLKTTVP